MRDGGGGRGGPAGGGGGGEEGLQGGARELLLQLLLCQGKYKCTRRQNHIHSGNSASSCSHRKVRQPGFWNVKSSIRQERIFKALVAVATLFIFFVFFSSCIPNHIHTMIQYSRPSPFAESLSMSSLHLCSVGNNLPGVASRGLNSGLPFSRPSHY